MTNVFFVCEKGSKVLDFGDHYVARGCQRTCPGDHCYESARIRERGIELSKIYFVSSTALPFRPYSHVTEWSRR